MIYNTSLTTKASGLFSMTRTLASLPTKNYSSKLSSNSVLDINPEKVDSILHSELSELQDFNNFQGKRSHFPCSLKDLDAHQLPIKGLGNGFNEVDYPTFTDKNYLARKSEILRITNRYKLCYGKSP